jgi:hypothetical protein
VRRLPTVESHLVGHAAYLFCFSNEANLLSFTVISNQQICSWITVSCFVRNFAACSRSCELVLVTYVSLWSALVQNKAGVLKISDFGLAKVRPDPKKQKEKGRFMTGETGSYRFMYVEKAYCGRGRGCGLLGLRCPY